MQGETVPYIICVEKDSEGNVSGAQKGLAERAHHPDEINAASELAIDAEYYLTQQVSTFMLLLLLHDATFDCCQWYILAAGAVAAGC